MQRRVASEDLEGQMKDPNDEGFVKIKFKIEVCLWKVLDSD